MSDPLTWHDLLVGAGALIGAALPPLSAGAVLLVKLGRIVQRADATHDLLEKHVLPRCNRVPVIEVELHEHDKQLESLGARVSRIEHPSHHADAE